MHKSTGSGDGFFAGIKDTFIPGSTSSSQPAQESSSAKGSGSYLPNPSNLLVDLAPHLVGSSSRLLHPSNISSHQASLTSSHSPSTTTSLRRKISFIRAGLSIGRPNAPLQSWSELGTQLYLRDRVDELLRLPVPPAPFNLSSASTSAASAQQGQLTLEAPPPRPEDPVPLFQGFRATIPAAQASKTERRRRRALLSERALGLEDGKLGLKERGDKARGMLGGLGEFGEVEQDNSLTIGRRSKGRRKTRGPVDDEIAGADLQSREDLEKDAKEVEGDMANIAVRRALLNGQIKDVEAKIAALEKVREDLRKGLLGLREEELELEDELEGIESRLARLPLNASLPSVPPTAANGRARPEPTIAPLLPTSSSRRRKGPAFLPSEHDELPTNVAFMTLSGHLSPILALDFTEPYGTLVSSSSDSSVRLWDLTTGTETGFLKGHDGLVKALQVEGSVCVTGGEEGGIRVWDLDKAEEMFYSGTLPTASLARSMVAEEDVFGPTATVGAGGLVNGVPAEDDGVLRESSSVRDGVEANTGQEQNGPCVRHLQGHTKAVTSLFFDGSTLVTGSSDSTLRQWDLTTGQCVQTMDILWAISNPLPSSSISYPASSYSHSNTDPFASAFAQPAATLGSPPVTPRKQYAASLRRQSSLFESPGAMAAPTTATYADGSWELYDDFVGGVMFWGYALASGTRDGCVRLWDMRTGQAHRTLVGHTGPVTCLQFDEYHLVSGSLDRTIRIWDLRTGAISDTLRYDHAVTSLQFDSRKVVAAAGENGVKVYNRTTMEHSSLMLGGHTAPAEKLRFMDKYLASGGRDATVKIWALQ
ncbi:Mitochondrial fission protein [Rhodotorula toruloides]